MSGRPPGGLPPVFAGGMFGGTLLWEMARTGRIARMDETRWILVSSHATGSGRFRDSIRELSNRPVLGPFPGAPRVAEERIAWHAAQVLRGPALAAG